MLGNMKIRTAHKTTRPRHFIRHFPFPTEFFRRGKLLDRPEPATTEKMQRCRPVANRCFLRRFPARAALSSGPSWPQSLRSLTRTTRSCSRRRPRVSGHARSGAPPFIFNRAYRQRRRVPLPAAERVITSAYFGPNK